MATCEPFLFEQIATIQPRVIVALGKFAAQSLLRTTEPITRLRGRVFEFRGAALIPTFHPAYLLRNPPAKRDVWEDMKKVREHAAGVDARGSPRVGGGAGAGARPADLSVPEAAGRCRWPGARVDVPLGARR